MSLPPVEAILAIGVETYIRNLATQHGVNDQQDALSRMAVKISELSGDDVKMGEIQQLLINLSRRKNISNSEAFCLLHLYKAAGSAHAS